MNRERESRVIILTISTEITDCYGCKRIGSGGQNEVKNLTKVSLILK